jgi:hypothetical protein
MPLTHLESQLFDFRELHSTTHQLVGMIQKTYKAFETEETGIFLYLDMSKAWAWCEIRIKIILFWHSSQNSPSASFLSKNNIFCASENSKMSLSSAVTQGSVVGRTLVTPGPSDAKLSLYPDGHCRALPLLPMHTLHGQWFTKWRIFINFGKTVVMLFTRRTHRHLSQLNMFNH